MGYNYYTKSKLFSSGLNLIILRIPDDDITDNVEVVCPTNIFITEIQQ